MKVDDTAAHEDLSTLNNRQLLELAVRRKKLTPLEVELMLRLESFIDAHGDYMTEV